MRFDLVGYSLAVRYDWIWSGLRGLLWQGVLWPYGVAWCGLVRFGKVVRFAWEGVWPQGKIGLVALGLFGMF